MNIVEIFLQLILPVAFKVVNIELAIWRDPSRLDGPKICTDEDGVWELLSHFNGFIFLLQCLD